ncbi:MAG: hypothetical protein ACYDDT_11540, partial [Sulfuricella sp.]
KRVEFRLDHRQITHDFIIAENLYCSSYFCLTPKTVVVTHFSPHRGCVAAQFDGKPLTPYFTVDLAPLMQKYQIALWTFGHTHHNVDFLAGNGCRVISNQLGYPSERNRDFRDDLLIEV